MPLSHDCGNSCFCRMHSYALYFAPENEELPEAGEHACILPDCPVWKNGDKGAILENERAGYVCTCDAQVVNEGGHRIEGYAQEFHSVIKIVHHKLCLLLAPPCFDCFGYASLPTRSVGVLGTVFRCPFHDRQSQSLLERFEGMFIDNAPGSNRPRFSGFTT